MTRDQVLGLLVGYLQKTTSPGLLKVSIDGRSCSGKTHLGDELADRLEALGRPCHRASLDDFHVPGYHRRLAAGDFTPESFHTDAYDHEALARLLLDPLDRGGDRRCRLDCWNRHEDEAFPEDWLEMEEDAVLLVDGLGLSSPPLHGRWDFSIWLDVDWEVMQLRMARRDAASSVLSPTASIRAFEEWSARHRHYEQTVKPHERVDVVIDNSDISHPYLVRLRPGLRR